MNTSYTSMDRPVNEDKIKNLMYIRQLYIFFSLSLLISFIWTSIVLSTNMKNWFSHHWIVGLIISIITGLIILFTLFAKSLRKTPASLGIYVIFVLFFAYFWSFVSSLNILFYYLLCLLTALSFGFALYAICSNNYLNGLGSFMYIFSTTGFVLLSFIIFTEMKIFTLIIIFILVGIFGYFINSDLRRVVKEDTFDSSEEDPLIDSIKLWIESLMVGCKSGENMSNMILNN